MTPKTQEWYDALAKATKERAHAIVMLERWNAKAAAAEAKMAALTAEIPDAPVAEPTPEPIPEPAPVQE